MRAVKDGLLKRQDKNRVGQSQTAASSPKHRGVPRGEGVASREAGRKREKAARTHTMEEARQGKAEMIRLRTGENARKKARKPGS